MKKKSIRLCYYFLVGVAQLAEHRVVAPVVEGSIPFTHPIFFQKREFSLSFFIDYSILKQAA